MGNTGLELPVCAEPFLVREVSYTTVKWLTAQLENVQLQ